MRLYRTDAGKWAGTQEEARALAKSAGCAWHQVEVPTDKPGLLAFLNQEQALYRAAAATLRRHPSADPVPPALREGAIADLARMEGNAAGIDVDALVAAISTSDSYRLARFAGAVAMAFGRLEARS